MIDDKRSDIDLEDTVKLPVIDERDHDIETKDPVGIIFPFVVKIGILLSLILTFTLVGRAIYIHFHETDLSLIDNTRLIFSGTNGNGIIQYHHSPQSAAITTLQTKKKELQRKNKDTTAITDLMDSIDCSFSQSSSLTNGQTITYACSYNKEAAKQLKFNIKDNSKEYTVMGLIDPTESNLTTIEEFKPINSEITSFSSSSLALEENYIYIQNNEEYRLLDDTFKQSMQDIAQIELDSFQQIITLGKESFKSYSPTFESITYNEDGTYTITLSLSNIYTETLPDYYHFTISYIGYFILNEDDSISFVTDTQHEPYYEGYGNEYFVVTK